MKQRLLLKVMLLLCALIAGSSSVWADVTWEETALSDLTPTDIFVIVGTNSSGSYSMSNNGGTSNPPTAASVTIVDGKITSTVTDVIQWNVSGNATDGYTFYPNGSTTTWLYCTNTNNGVRVGVNANKTFTVSNGYLKNTGTDPNRYVGIYNSQDWRCYTSTSSNISGQTFKFYKKVFSGASVADPIFSPTKGTYISSQSVTITCATDGATIYYTTDNSDPTSASTEYTGPITVDATTTVKAIAIKGSEKSTGITATYTILPVTHAGTEADPYTVSDARNAIDANTGIENVFVTGIVCTGGSSLNSGKLNYWISDDGTETNKLEAYKGKNLNNTNFTATTDVKVGDVVVIYGTLTKYNSTYEFVDGNYLTNFKVKPATPTLSLTEGLYTEVQNVTLSCQTEGANIYYTVDGSDPTSSSSVYSSAIAVNSTTTIKAIAIKEGVSSDIASATYTIDLSPFVLVSSTSIDATAEEGNGEITVTYGNMTSVVATVKFYESDGTTETTYDWFNAEINNSDNVYYTYNANTGAARTAYIKVYTTSSAGEVYSDLITISQEAYVPKITYTIATSIVPGKHYVIASGTNGAIKAMGKDKGNNRDAVEVTANTGSISFTEDAGVYEFVIYGPDANGRYSIYDETTGKEGYLYAAASGNNYLKTQTTNNINGKWKITIDGETKVASIKADGSSNRNVMQYNSSSTIFSCYSSASQGAVYLYEKDGEATPTIDVTLAASGYASYCSPMALDLTPTANYAAYAVTATSGSTVTFTKINGAVPAETPFILYGENYGGQTATLSAATGSTTAVNDNMLVGTLAPTAITTVSGDYTNFGLSGGSFVKINDGTLPANKAYLPILTSKVPTSLAPEFTIIFEDMQTTGVNDVRSKMADVRGDFFDLQGRKVANPTKGMYIVNGKKVIVK